MAIPSQLLALVIFPVFVQMMLIIGFFMQVAFRIADGSRALPLPPQAGEGAIAPTLKAHLPGCFTVSIAGTALPTPRKSGRYMSSTSDGGTV